MRDKGKLRADPRPLQGCYSDLHSDLIRQRLELDLIDFPTLNARRLCVMCAHISGEFADESVFVLRYGADCTLQTAPCSQSREPPFRRHPGLHTLAPRYRKHEVPIGPIA